MERAVSINMAIDAFGRKIDYLRISVTDRCNLRCKYCMPDGLSCKKDHEDILKFEDFIKIIKAFVKLGIKKIKITGGEPFVRKDCDKFIRDIKCISGIEKVTITTNAILLYDKINYLNSIGIDGINISIDTLDRNKFRYLTGGNIDNVIRSIDKLNNIGFSNKKLNTVIINGFNDLEIIDLCEFANKNNCVIRFIELMPIGPAKNMKGISKKKIVDILTSYYGDYEEYNKKIGNGPASYIRFKHNNLKIGFIDAIDHKFCASCNRVRITSDGFLKLCLQYNTGINLKDYVEDKINEQDFLEKISRVLMLKPKENKFKDYLNIQNINTNSMNEIGG